MWIEHNFMQFCVFIMMFIAIGLSVIGIAIAVKSYMTMRKLSNPKKHKKQKKQTKHKKKPKGDVILKEMP